MADRPATGVEVAVGRTAAEPPGPRPAARPPTLAHRLEYYALRATVGALGALSWRRASDVGARLGLLGYRPFGIRRDVVRSQIAASFPDLPENDVDAIARGAYESLGRTTVETAVLPRLSSAEVLALFARVDGWEIVEESLALGKGMILVAGHLGNWELGGSYLAARGIALDGIARGQGNPLFDRYLTETRTRIGIRVVHDPEAVRRTPRALRENRVVAFLIDQGVLGLASTWVPFFGRMAKTPRGPAVFALRFGAPVVFATALRLPDGRFVLALERVPVTTRVTGRRDVDRYRGRLHGRCSNGGCAGRRRSTSGITGAGSTSSPMRRVADPPMPGARHERRQPFRRVAPLARSACRHRYRCGGGARARGHRGTDGDALRPDARSTS